MEVFIVSGGNIDKDRLHKMYKQAKNPLIIAADSGFNSLFDMKIKADYIIGDLDSIDTKKLNTLDGQKSKILRYPPEKDYTDGYLAMEKAFEILENTKKGESLYIFGAIGSRLDHSLANCLSIFSFIDISADIDIKFFDPKNIIIPFKSPKKLTIKKGEYEGYKYLSLIPLSKKIKNLKLKGFKYNLDGKDVYREKILTISNEFVSCKAQIEATKGQGLVIISKD